MQQRLPESRLRYVLEHQILRKWFYQKSKEMINLLVHKPNTIFETMQRLSHDNGYQVPYTATDYKMQRLRFKGEQYILLLTMPKPTNVAECFRIYLCFGENFAPLAYITVEKGMEQTDFLCGWNQEGMHVNYHVLDQNVTLEEERKLVADILSRNG